MSSKNKERRERRTPDSTPLVNPTILLAAVANTETGTNDNPSECKRSVQFGQSTIKISNSSKDGFNGMHCMRQKLINDRLSKESIDTIMPWSRTSKNTSKKFITYTKQWLEFCEKSNRGFQNATIKDGLDFWTNIFYHKKNYSTISRTQSVLSLVINTENIFEFNKQ